MRMLICPCCERPALPSTTRVPERDCELAFIQMQRRGWTAARLLAEQSATLDLIGPGMTDWLRARIARG